MEVVAIVERTERAGVVDRLLQGAVALVTFFLVALPLVPIIYQSFLSTPLYEPGRALTLLNYVRLLQTPPVISSVGVWRPSGFLLPIPKGRKEAMSMLPLEDLRVLDLSRLVAGNMLTLVLADFGADVVKVEQPGVGDPLRTWKTNNLDLWWKVYARNKRSITLNLAHPQGRVLLLRMVDRSDVLVENFVPGTLERWGIGPDVLLARNPRLVVVRISGWGQTGPYRDRPGLGTLIKAMSGFAAMTGFPDRPPTLPPFPLADMVAALWGVAATVIAVHHARLSGNGQVIDLAILEPLFAVLGPVAAEYRLTGKVRERIGNRSHNAAPRNTYRTKDGHWVAISASTPNTAACLLEALGLAELLSDSRFATNEARVQNTEALDQFIEEAIGRYTLQDLMELFARNEVTAGPVYNVP